MACIESQKATAVAGFNVRRATLALLLGLSIPVPTTADPLAAAGWLQLERDQRTYRERVEPLDLREQRQLGAIERQQRNDLRAVEQRARRTERLDRRLSVTRPDSVPRRDGIAERRRAIERLRLRTRTQQYGLPFGSARRR